MRHARILLLGLLALAALVAAACEAQYATPPTPTGTVSGSPTPTSPMASTVTAEAEITPAAEITPMPTETASLPEALLQLLGEDLAEALTVGVNPIDTPAILEVVRVEAVESVDDCIEHGHSAAACPPAELTPGYRVTLRRIDFGVEYFYYTDGEERFTRPWQLPLPSPVPISPDALPPPLLELLREDLGERLGVMPESIQLVLVEETVWDGCLGVPSGPDTTDGRCLPSGLMLGYRVTLSAAGGEHRYHTEREEPFLRIYVGPVNNQ